MTMIPIIKTGTANLASVCAAIERAGCTPELTESLSAVIEADKLVLPGVGSFGAVMEQLRTLGLVEALRARIEANRPTMCICLGMQILAQSSEESPGVTGLGIIPSMVRRFDASGIRVPQLGWNRVTPTAGEGMLAPGEAFFANSFRISTPPEGWRRAATHHGGSFISAIERGDVLACQFHPELSGRWGADLIGRWLEGVRVTSTDDRAESPGDPSGEALPRVIPCLDVKDGRVVKGVKFQGLRDAGDPVERAAAYEAQGADELVILDVSATPEGRGHAVETVAAVRRVLSIPLTVGGGVRKPDDAARLLDAGADKVGVNTAAVTNPELVTELAGRFGVQCTVVAVDGAHRDESKPELGWEVVIKSGTERTGIDAVRWCKDCESRGAGEILLTSWDRDGTRSGYDVDLLRAVTEKTRLPVIASGGVNDPDHLAEGIECGATGVLAASIFHDGDWTVDRVKDAMAPSLHLPLRMEHVRA